MTTRTVLTKRRSPPTGCVGRARGYSLCSWAMIPNTARRLQYLAKVSGGVYFRFDPRKQEQQFSEMLVAMSAYAAGGEEAVKRRRVSGDPAAATSQAGADANHQGARSRAGELRPQGMTALNKWTDLLEQIVSGRKPATVVKMPKRK